MIIMWIEKAINMQMFRKLFITLICIGTIYISFTMVATGDDKTGEETIQLSLPPATKQEEIKLPEDNEKKDASEQVETIQLSLPPATKKEDIKLPEDNEKKDVSEQVETIQLSLPPSTKQEDIKLPEEIKKKDAFDLEKTTIELTTGTREITQDESGWTRRWHRRRSPGSSDDKIPEAQ